MAFNTWDLGDKVRVDTADHSADGGVDGRFKDATTDAPLDPALVKLSVRSPNGPTVTYVYLTDAIIVKDATGTYHADIDANEAGTWYYRWWSTGNGQAADEQRFEIREHQAV